MFAALSVSLRDPLDETGNVPHSRVRGPLAEFADGFRVELDRLGYTPWSREYKINQMARLSRWLDGKDLAACALNDELLAAFLLTLATRRRGTPTALTMKPLLDWLGVECVIAPCGAASHGMLDELIDDYRQWMIIDRALSRRTINRYVTTARRFLHPRATAAGSGLGTEGSPPRR